MAKTSFRNVDKGARGVWSKDGTLHMVEPGQSVSIEVDDAELKDQKSNGFFEIGKASKAKADDDEGGEKGPLDGSITSLKEHLATVDDVDALKKLGITEAACQNRKGALEAIQDRIDELEAA